MERQYVGARYVPIVYTNPDDGSASWKANVEYEPLTIVVANNGDSYTSKKAVPKSVGTPQDNLEYWVKTGDFNASLLALQNRVNTLENTTIPAIEQNIDDVESNIDTIEGEREFNLSHKRYVLIGDSLGTGDYSGNTDGGWCNYFKSVLNLTEGVNAFTTAISGKGWSTTGVNYLSMAQALTVSDPDTITDVIVLGGLNDYQTSFDDERSAANTLFSYLHNRFKNAAIRFGVIGRSRDNYTVNDNLENNIIPAIKNSNAQYIEGSDLFGRWYDRYTDTWHWDDNYTLVFSILLAANYGTKIHVDNKLRSTTFTPDSDFAKANNPIPFMRQNENEIIIPESTVKLFQYSTDKAFSSGNFLDIHLGTLQSNIAGNGKLLIPVSGYIGFSAPTDEFFPYTGHICLTAGTNGNSDMILSMCAVFPHDTSYVSRTVHNFVINIANTSISTSFC